ncbi:MAG: hypothetical protein M0C28_43125 [Candidatus Moduliflexus flocculans]|nr:hypothetical protein [Candidatus Moduliflexus flocculans]
MIRKKGMENLVFYTYLRAGLKATVVILDAMKELGFKYATQAGFSLGIDDFVIPGEKKALVEKAEKEVQRHREASTGTAPSPRASASTASSRSGARSPRASPRP